MIKRVGLLGGPGVGKSTLAAKIFADLKAKHYPIELVDEAIKGMAWRKIKPTGFDSVWLFGKQMHQEDIVLRSGGLVITGGPLIQQIVYAPEEHRPHMLGLAREFEKKYPSVNILLTREVPYQVEGRYQNKESALLVDDITRLLLIQWGEGFREFKPSEYDDIINDVYFWLSNTPSLG